MKASKDVIDVVSIIVPGYQSTVIDTFTDSIMLNEAICKADAPLLERVINNYHVNYWKGYSQQENLLKYLEGEEGYRYQGYTHYWGGHQVILKPLLLIFDYSDLLIFNYIFQAMLFIAAVMGLCKTGRQYAVIPFSVAVLTMMPIAVAVCLQFSTVYDITMLGIICLTWFSKKKQKYMIFLLLGMATSYFDFLTYPFVCLGFPLAIAVMYAEDEGWLRQIAAMVQNSAAWCVGYLGMWTGKWILGSLLLPEGGSLKVAIEAIQYRASNTAYDQDRLTILDVVLKNLFVYLRRPTILFIAIPVIYYMIKIVYKRLWAKEILLSYIPYLLLCLYPVAWYLISRNHSYEHAFMAYRELAIATASGLLALAGAERKKAR